MEKTFKASCSYCGAEAGDISERTEQKATAIYDCEKCFANYCDQCSYAKDDTSDVQMCLRCDSVMEKIDWLKNE